MENALYYTFSTIPQVLAGAIALLGAFVLFKVHSVHDKLSGKSGRMYEELWKRFKNHGTIHEEIPDLKAMMVLLQHGRNYQEIHDYWIQENNIEAVTTKMSPETGGFFKRLFEDFKESLKEKRTVLRWFKCSLWATIPLILLSVTALPLIPKYLLCTWWMVPTIIASILWLTMCFLFYGILIYKTIR